MLPLRRHVINAAVKPDHRLHVGGRRGLGVAAIFGAELVGRERNKGGEMGTSGIAH
jgi:hypothetical protein